MRTLLIVFCLFTFLSCDYFSVKEKEVSSSEIVAIVNKDKLFKKDLKKILPKIISREDSLVLVKNYIQDWAIKKLFLKKAETNNSAETLKEIENLVNDYRESLLINNYKTEIIHQKLDTVVSDQEIEDYYNLNKENFKLNEELVKANFLYIDNNLKNQKEIIRLFKSEKIEDKEELERKQLSFKTYQLNDSVWMEVDKILLKIPIPKEILLKKTKFIQKQDSLGLYLVSVKDVLPRNEIAPLNYIESKIKQMILHKRKIELIRDIEKIIITDAIQNKHFKVY